jgi:predicted metal-dependent phosphoesterase TrpH
MHTIKPTASERNGKELPKLWELGRAIEEIESAITEILDADDLTETEKEARAAHAFNEWLQTGASFDEKAAQVAGYIRHVEALADARKEESRRLRELAAQAENRASALRRYLTHEMLRTGRTKIEGVRAKLSLRQKPP